MSTKNLNKISRFLIKILRHNPLDYKLNIDNDGFVDCNELLKLPSLNFITIEDIKEIVSVSDKQRFNLKNVDGKYYIAANQGHSIKIQSSLLKPITLENIDNYENKNIVHGSYYRVKDKIFVQGLSRMKRQHIHFTKNSDLNKVVSGFRKSCEILIFINMKKAIIDGYNFFESPNGVILCSGNEHGILPPKYFIKIEERK